VLFSGVNIRSSSGTARPLSAGSGSNGVCDFHCDCSFNSHHVDDVTRPRQQTHIERFVAMRGMWLFWHFVALVTLATPL